VAVIGVLTVTAVLLDVADTTVLPPLAEAWTMLALASNEVEASLCSSGVGDLKNSSTSSKPDSSRVMLVGSGLPVRL
jgi:hypothetical protein